MRRLAALLAALLALAACTDSGRPPLDRAAGSASPSAVVGDVERPVGGSARVGVFDEPDPGSDTIAGRAVRELTRPALFVATPSGGWEPSLVVAGSVSEAADGMSVSFRLVDGAVWSDGTPIGVADLERTRDERFVAGIGGPAADGTITVRLTHPIAGWQRLWSSADAIAPPTPGVFGGPFQVASRTPGLETVLEPNPSWWGTGPFLQRLTFVLVPDVVTMSELFEDGDLDVIMPLPVTELDLALEEIEGVETAQTITGGWWFGLVVNGDRIARSHRRALAASVERVAFTTGLLHEEAALLDSFTSRSGPAPSGAWHGADRGDVSALADRSEVQLSGFTDVPMSRLVQRSIQRGLRDDGISLELRNAESDVARRWLVEGDYDAALVLEVDPPEPCWTCRWGSLLPEVAVEADGGSPEAVAAMEQALADEGFVLPLWRPHLRVAWRPPLAGIVPNGWGHSPAWNAWRWWIDDDSDG